MASWMDETLPMGERSYLMRQRTRVTWYTIAKRLGYRSTEGARGAALRYAKKNKLPWPVPTLTRGFMYYQAFLDGESWVDIAHDWSDTTERVQNCARQWARRYNLKWPARFEDEWEKNIRFKKNTKE